MKSLINSTRIGTSFWLSTNHMEHIEFPKANSIFMSTCQEYENISMRLSFIDKYAVDYIKQSENFKSFIDYSVNLIEAQQSYHQIKLERLDDSDINGIDHQYKLTFYIREKNFISITDEMNFAPRNLVYKKLIKNLFKRDKFLRKQMILDERVI